jgi:hypothetical protein
LSTRVTPTSSPAHVTAGQRDLDRVVGWVRRWEVESRGIGACGARLAPDLEAQSRSAHAAHGSPPTSRRSRFTDASGRSGLTAAAIASTIGTRVGTKMTDLVDQGEGH